MSGEAVSCVRRIVVLAGDRDNGQPEEGAFFYSEGGPVSPLLPVVTRLITF